MISPQAIRKRIEQRFPGIRFALYAGKPHDRMLYTSTEAAQVHTQPVSFPVRQDGKAPYKVRRHGGCIDAAFFYPDGYQVVLRLFQQVASMLPVVPDDLHLLFYPLYAEAAIVTKETELETMIEGIRAITSSLDRDELLKSILSNALTVIPAGDTGMLWLYDPQLECLELKAAVGFDPALPNLRLQPGESIVGEVFQTGQARIYYRQADILQAVNLSGANLAYLESLRQDAHIEGLLCVPVAIGGQSIGVMLMHQKQKEAKITERDLQLLQGFAAQAAIAIENARLFSEVKMQNQLLVRRTELHDTLTQLSLQNKGAETIVTELSRMIGMPLAFVDYLEGIWMPKQTGTSPTFSPDEIALVFSSRSCPVTIDVDANGQPAYFLYPIVTGRVFLGCVVVTLERTLTSLDLLALEQGRSVLALELVKKRSLTELYYKKSYEFFLELLQNKDSDGNAAKATELGLDPNDHLLICLVELHDDHDLQLLEAGIHRLVVHLKSALPTVDKLAFGFHNKITLLLALATPAEQPAVMERLQSILLEWERREAVPVSAGVGTLQKGVGLLAKSHEEAAKALAYLTKRKQSGLIRYEEIGVNRLFLNQSAQEMEVFLHEVFAPLRTVKARNNELEKTLLAYIGENFSASRTADMLHIHINTLYQRLRKIEEMVQLSFEEPEDRLKIQLACHLRKSFP